MMERVDAGKDPKGPNTMGLSDGSSLYDRRPEQQHV